jgi:hypothetical protein
MFLLALDALSVDRPRLSLGLGVPTTRSGGSAGRSRCGQTSVKSFTVKLPLLDGQPRRLMAIYDRAWRTQ